MRTPVVDYRKFRLSKLRDPQYSHLLLLLGWIVYFGLYFLTENLIPATDCTPMHMKLDDMIPFNEWFVIPYVFWYVLIAISLVWFALYNVDGFKRLQIFIIITQLVAMACYIAFPSCQNLRPTQFPRDNFLSKCVGFLYSFDTNTGVCPSLHVAYSMGIMSVWLKQKDTSIFWRLFVVVSVILICLSTMFIKQHSAVDVFAAMPLSLLAEAVVYGKSYWLPKFKKQKV